MNNRLFKLFTALISLLAGLALLPGWADAKEVPSKYVVIDKGIHRMFLYRDGKVIESFAVSLGIDSVSPKRCRGDKSTPEGCYYVTCKKSDSKFYKFLGLSYPNKVDAWLGLRKRLVSSKEYRSIVNVISAGGCPPARTSLGSDIGIHGGGVYRNSGKCMVKDWTKGCVAVDNQAMDVIYSFCNAGDMVIILNSKHQFFDMMRPFGNPMVIDQTSEPGRKGKKYLSELGFVTVFGQALLRLKEGTDYSRSIEILLFGDGTSMPPSYVVFDRNGDGILGYGDKQTGSLGTAKRKQNSYNRLLVELKKALRKGRLLACPEK
ncbi:MAG: L,D-transpeptidase [Thermodesulfobacteriota bacterium]|nr:L,D-transpeptidase [Thermodesulfobacteriota bacterium]